MKKLSEIKSLDGESLINNKCKYELDKNGVILNSHFNDVLSGYNNSIAEHSTRQVEVVIDRDKLAMQIAIYKDGGFKNMLPNKYDYMEADFLINSILDWTKIVYVKGE